MKPVVTARMRASYAASVGACVVACVGVGAATGACGARTGLEDEIVTVHLVPRPDGGVPGEGARDGGAPRVDAGCVKTAEAEVRCDGRDDDCNGLVDDVDVGGDGLCDCVRIGLVGRAGTYESSDFLGWLEERGTTVTRIQAGGQGTLDARALAPFDVVVLDWLARDYRAAEIAAFRTWIDDGHGAIALSGYADGYEVTRPNGLLAGFGLAFTSAATFAGRRAVSDFSPSPITAGLGSVTFYGGSEVRLTSGVSGYTQASFARLDGRTVGAVATRASADGREGRVLAWGDEFVEFDSEWRTMPDVPRFWVNVFGFLAPSCVLADPVSR